MGGQTTIYDHYKFLTKEDLERLNLTNLIGTNLLRAYMHGFFINHALYKKVGCLWCIFLFTCIPLVVENADIFDFSESLTFSVFYETFYYVKLVKENHVI